LSYCLELAPLGDYTNRWLQIATFANLELEQPLRVHANLRLGDGL